MTDKAPACSTCGGEGEVRWLTNPPDPQTEESAECHCVSAPVTAYDLMEAPDFRRLQAFCDLVLGEHPGEIERLYEWMVEATLAFELEPVPVEEAA